MQPPLIDIAENAGRADPDGIRIGETEATAAALRRLLPAGATPLFDAAFIRSSRLYEEFVHRLTLRVFREAGLDSAVQEAGSLAEIAARAGLEPDRALVPLDWILRQLVARDVLRETRADQGLPHYRFTRPLEELDPAPVRDEQARHDPSWLPSYALAETVAKDYPAFLQGQARGEAILFSPARLRLWLDYFSNDNGLYGVNNQVGALGALEWMRPAHDRILELGGGLGSAAVALLDRLDSLDRLRAIREYRFTELVPAFLRRGQEVLRRRFPDPSFLAFGQLDMNRPFGHQNLSPGSVSVVYAVNTLHVAHDLDFTLREIVHALAPGGRLIISECVRPHPGQAIHVEFIFNLMEAFRSPILHPHHRPNGGFLTPEQWAGSLAAAGLTDVEFLPDIMGIRDQFPQFSVAAISATRPT